MSMTIKNETGKKYGDLIVIERSDQVEPSNRCIKWICKCACGNIVEINGNNLRFGRAMSCGKCNKQLRGKHK